LLASYRPIEVTNVNDDCFPISSLSITTIFPVLSVYEELEEKLNSSAVALQKTSDELILVTFWKVIAEYVPLPNLQDAM
jgi:hypothetical protein